MGRTWLDLAWTDLLGRTQVVRTTREACETGEVRVPRARLLSGFSAESDEPGYVDLRPDFASERLLPWDEDVAVCMADLYEDGQPSRHCSRGFLRKAADRAVSNGYSIEAAVELEFYLLDPETHRPIYDQIDNYSLARVEGEPVISAFRNEMRAMGIGVEASNPEYGGGQFEVNIAHTELLGSADQAVLARLYTGTIAKRLGLESTYLSKPWTDESSSGIHVHQSLWKEQRNLFYEGHDSLSPVGLSYLAGLLGSMADFALLGSPTPNGFHRRADGSFAPTMVAWSTDNRTTAVRAIFGGESGTRIEHRDGGSDCNLYLTMGAQVEAGLDGMERELEAPEPVVGNAYEMDLPVLPRTYIEAYEALQRSELAARLIPEPILETYLQILEPELELSITSSSEWERERYGEVPLR